MWRFLKFSIDSFIVCDYDHIIQVEGEFCKGCIYKMLYEYYHRKVLDMRDFIGNWCIIYIVLHYK